jgi:hypothetical protein
MGKHYDTPEGLVSEARNNIEGIHPDFLKSVFESWKGRLLESWNSDGEEMDSTFHFDITMSV